ncbi:MAG: tetratricopeptide repeat protein, partial [Phycisphaerales bacterium]|nr:tetratricopeptide repeat protein [Phycisphaerales bacterium]
AWGCALYHLERYTEAADVLLAISEPERTGPLATTALMLADCLLRTLPPDNDDALSTGRMLQQAEQAQKQLLGFLTANPNHPEAPLANFKLGYCYQIMIANKKEGPHWEWPGKAWDCYNKVDAAVQGTPLAAAAILERAKVIQRTGDTGRAEGELKRFLTEPLNKADCSREALYKLGGLWRLMGRPAEGAELLNKLLAEQPESSPGIVIPGLTRLIEYEYALCLKDANKRDDAKAVLSRLTESTDPAIAANSRWRLAQIERERLTALIDAAKLKLRRARQPAATDAARKELTDAATAMRQWLDSQITPALHGTPPIAPALAGITAREGESRLWYEYAWSFRALEDAATELEEPAPLFRMGSSTDIDSVFAFRRSAEIGSLGNAAARESANFANLDLGEMLAQHNRLDEAMDAFSGVLHTGGQARDLARARLRIAQCLLTKGDAHAAIRQAELIPRWSGRVNGQGRYVIGESYLHMNDPKRAIATLRVFLDDRNSLFAVDAADKALLRLGETLEQHLRPEEAALAYEFLLKKSPRSPLADEVRARLITTKYSWGGIMSRPRSAL